MSTTPQDGDSTPTRDPQAAFAELSKIMLGAQPLTETLARVAEVAKQTIPAASDVSVTLMQEGSVASVAFTGSLAAHLDERQYDAGFGPCMDAATSGTTILITDTAASDAYPDFGRAARRRGIVRTMSVGLPVEQQVVGALNVYGADEGTFDEAAQELASVFASYAAVAVANAGLYASTANLAHHLQRALESRGVIEQAKGILMAQLGVSADAAFTVLTERSQRSNRKLRDIAKQVIDELPGSR